MSNVDPRKAVIQQEFEKRGVQNANADIDAAFDEFLASASDELIIKALRTAGEEMVPVPKIIRYVRSFIENEKHPEQRPPRFRREHRNSQNDNRYAPPSLRHLKAPDDVWDT